MCLSVVIPAFNEETRILETLRATSDYLTHLDERTEIIVVDDGSSDRTVQVCEQFAQNNPQANLRVVSYELNRGKGYAVRQGMLQATGNIRLFCDADLATPIEEYQVLLDSMKSSRAQIAIGSRPLKASNLLVHQPKYRELLGRIFNSAVQHLAVSGIEDTQCGFKLFTAEAAEEVFSLCKLDRYAFDSEALYIASVLGYKITEVPIRWSHKEGSKVSLIRDGTRMVFDLLTIRLIHRSLVLQRPIKSVSHSHPEL